MPPETNAVEPLRTEGLSPKTILAAALPTLGGVIAVLIQWVATGEFDRAELATAVSAVAASVLAGLGAYLGRAGRVIVAQPVVAVPAAGAGAKHTGIE